MDTHPSAFRDATNQVKPPVPLKDNCLPSVPPPIDKDPHPDLYYFNLIPLVIPRSPSRLKMQDQNSSVLSFIKLNRRNNKIHAAFRASARGAADKSS